MENLAHHTSTGYAAVDSALGALVALLGGHFPGRISGVYVIGSYAVGCPVASSDLDLLVLFKDAFQADEEQRCAELLDSFAATCPLELDAHPQDEATARQLRLVKFKTASLLVAGSDIRASVDIRPLDEHIRHSMFVPVRLFARQRQTERLRLPLDFPDPAAPFCGYTSREIDDQPSTKELVTIVVLMATGLIALDGREHVRHKSECAAQYARLINDAWAGHIATSYSLCRDRWEYRIPEDPALQAQLRAFCQRQLEFERYFMARYRAYLRTEIQGADPAARAIAAERWAAVDWD